MLRKLEDEQGVSSQLLTCKFGIRAGPLPFVAGLQLQSLTILYVRIESLNVLGMSQNFAGSELC